MNAIINLNTVAITRTTLFINHLTIAKRTPAPPKEKGIENSRELVVVADDT